MYITIIYYNGIIAILLNCQIGGQTMKICITIDEEDAEKLKKISEKNCRSISGQVRFWIRNEE